MPIKAENKARYPKDWPQIVARIRERAGNKCEKCGVPNGALIYRDEAGAWHEVGEEGKTYDQPLLSSAWARSQGFKVIRVVCTTGHLDHIPEHVSDDNLRYWCQRDHLAYDAQHHAQTAYKTRRKHKAIDMFGEVE